MRQCLHDLVADGAVGREVVLPAEKVVPDPRGLRRVSVQVSFVLRRTVCHERILYLGPPGNYGQAEPGCPLFVRG
jgi:hypothetical protein